jgi:hypothetical protein
VLKFEQLKVRLNVLMQQQIKAVRHYDDNMALTNVSCRCGLP